ncbi:MAG: transporter related [Ignavibacteria bacterium]|nr:transporter related [Ignavibacteria bacterium]
MNKTILKAENISKSYSMDGKADTEVLKDLSIEIMKGETVSLVGPSGVGKSTLLHLLGTLDEPDSGRILHYDNGSEIELNKLTRNQTADFRNRHIGFVFQFHHLLVEFNALENVMMPALIAGLSNSKAADKARQLIELVGLTNRADHKPGQLSGGEQQRIAIARALINEPGIVFADEPTGNLDGKNSKAVLALISDLRQRFNITFVVATHNEEIATSTDRVLVMGEGRILGER